MSAKSYHLYHLVDPSPWPIVTAVGLFGLTTGSVMCFHFYNDGLIILLLGLLTVLLSAFVWWRDIIRESTFEGFHTEPVQNGIRIGVVLFIVSEVMFFSSFFWAFFHSSLAPTIELGGVWPPIGLSVFNPFEVPFLNTVVLVLSGATITWAHFGLLENLIKNVMVSLNITIYLALFFTLLQLCEYTEATFSMSDGVYGSVFYMATGFHGFHVIVGTIFILVTAYRIKNFHLSRKHHLGFLAASWYWHFVDVVWLFLFIAIYWWGNFDGLILIENPSKLFNSSNFISNFK